ncbi:MAG TPA: hypothetical protein VLJ59_12910 [Mycobacteriales bacterium]|nr:hypothetical protein [Mycobacteriales bacterium]
MRTVLRHCPSCGDEREFETPPCADGPGPACPELGCVDCGTALFAGLDPALFAPPVVGGVSVSTAA